jgi:hypothetical protein
LPEIVGMEVFVGDSAGSGVTAAVAAEVAGVDPPAFDAVTTARIVNVTSMEVRAYVCDVAPATSAQLAPPESHRRHWYA